MMDDEKSESPRGLRILVVDDNIDAAETLGMLIDVWGYSARVTLSGQEALKVAPELVPHVVILDIGLPGMDGFEVARRMRQVPGLEKAMLIALTGYGQEEDRRRTRDAGFNLHLVKPVEPEALLAILESVGGQPEN